MNFNKEVEKVKHSELTRIGESPYRSECPICKAGVLLVGRDQKTFILLEHDICIGCAQQFQYLDIDELRKREGDI